MAHDPCSYRSIGAGTCGTVYEDIGSMKALKLAKSNNEQLWNDYRMHTRTLEKFADSPLANSDRFSIPQCRWFASRDDKVWWDTHRARFPDPSRIVVPRDVLCTERILPLPEELRHAIIDHWCPEGLKKRAKEEKTNQDCLVRVYLGRPRTPRTKPLATFQLRNFNLWMDMADGFQNVDYGEVASTMGKALAIMHWSVGTDARDVEFVLGSAPTPPESPVPAAEIDAMAPSTSTWRRVTGHDGKRRAVRLWMLDFNRCRPITRTEQGVAECVHAFFTNDPYFPRPLSDTPFGQLLWEEFCNGYEKAGKFALKAASPKEQGLVQLFIIKVVEEQEARTAKQAQAEARLEADGYTG